MAALITGGAGFIGSHLADRAVAGGLDVVVIDNLSTGSIDNVPEGVPFYEIDVLDRDEVEKVFAGHGIDAVFHLAASVNLTESVSNPAGDAINNIGGLLRIYSAARDHGVRRFVFSSSAAVYGIPHEVPVTEDHPQVPISPYGLAKLTCERYLGLLDDGMEKVIFRFGNVYGPRQNAEGKGEGGIVSIFLDRLSRGADVELRGFGRPVRDYIYVSDIVDALMLGLECEPGTYNLGTCAGTTVDEVWGLMQEEYGGYQGQARRVPLRPGEIESLVLSSEKARGSIGWEPATHIKQGLAATIGSYGRGEDE